MRYSLWDRGVILEKIDALGQDSQVVGQVVESVDDIAVKGGVHQVGHEDPGVAPQLVEGPGQPGAHRRPGDVHHDDDAFWILLLQTETPPLGGMDTIAFKIKKSPFSKGDLAGFVRA